MRLVVSATTARMGGALVHLRNILAAWTADAGNHEIWVLVPPFHIEELGSHPLPENVHLLTSDLEHQSPLRNWIWSQVKLPSILKELQADVLISMHNFAPFVHTCPTILLVSNAIYFSRMYERDIRRLDSKLYWDMRMRRILVNKCIRDADLVVTPTQALKSDIMRLCEMPSEKIEVVHWGVDNSIFHSVHGDRLQSPHRSNLLFVSHHAPHKNFPTLVEACRLLQDYGQDEFQLTLTISETENTPHSCRTVKLIRELGLADRVQLVGSKSHQESAKLYKKADLFIFPSYCESFGLPMVEAMASGLPIVASDIPNNREICGSSAVYFPPFDSKALANLLQEVMVNSDLCQSLTRAGLERGKRFSWQITAGKLLELAAIVNNYR